MRTIDSTNVIEVYEVDGEEIKGLKSLKPSVTVTNHWNRKEFVVIVIDNKRVTVVANDLIKAIENAQNAHGY